MAANTDNLRKGTRRFSTTIGVGGVADDSVTTIPLTTVSGLATDTAVDITIDRVDGEGDLSPTNEEVVTGVVSGSNLITCVRGVEGTAQAHAAGAVVEMRLTAAQHNDHIDAFIEEHDQDGAHNDQAAITVMEYIYPVGTVYINATSSTNPATLLGIGTWTAWGVGKAIVGIDTGDTDFDTAEETGGAKTHTLTEAEMPEHTHVQNSHTHSVSDPGHAHNTYVTAGDQDGGGSNGAVEGGRSTSSSTTGISIGGKVATNQNAGSGDAHNNLQPYQIGYVWKRTA